MLLTKLAATSVFYGSSSYASVKPLTFVSTHLSATHLAVDALRILAEPWRVQEGKRKKKDEVVQQALGARIRQLREKKGWSQEDFAARSGLHRTFVGNIERGLKNTTILTLLMISKSLGITVAELLRGLEKKVEDLRKRTAK